jgi:hypothetical protein
VTVLINTPVSIQSQSTARRNGQSEREKHAGQALVQGSGSVVDLEPGGHLARLARAWTVRITHSGSGKLAFHSLLDASRKSDYSRAEGKTTGQ